MEAKLDMLITALAEEVAEEPVARDSEGNEISRQRDEFAPS
jgi:hypothetical protein